MAASGVQMQRTHPLEGIPARLWQAVAMAPHRLLMLDYDGTLAPFSADRARALPPERSRELLERLAARPGTTVAIVSGRPLGDLQRLTGPLPVTLVGEHGWELRDARGAVLRHPPSAQQAALLERADLAARGHGLGARLERKHASLVLHTRGLSPDEAAALQREATRLWRHATASGGARLDRIERGLELRLRGHDKGTAVATLRSRVPAGTLAVYVGDEATDEDAFGAIRDGGFGVRVGDPGRPTRATAWLPDPAGVTAFLEEWLRVTGG